MRQAIGPSTGTNNIVCTKSSGTAGIKVVAASYTGTNQSAIDNSAQGTAGGGLTYSQSLTTVADNSWVIFTAGNNGGSDVQSNDAGTTLRVQLQQGGILDSNAAVTPAGARTLYAKKPSDTPDAWGSTIISLAPAVDAPSPILHDAVFFFE